MAVMRNGVILVVAFAMILVACGGSSGSKATTAPKMDAQGVVKALQASGMPIGDTQVYDASSDPNSLLGRPNQYTSKVNFNDTRLPKAADFDTSAGGSVEVFASDADAAARMKYIQSLGKATPLLLEYDYQNGKILLRVSSKLTPDQAKAYEDALKAMP